MLSVNHLGLDPGSSTGGATLLDGSAPINKKIPVLLWAHYRRAYKTHGKKRTPNGFLLDVYKQGGYHKRYRLQTLIEILRVIRQEVLTICDVWSLTVEGLFIGEDKSQRDMIELIDSAGVAKGVLAHPKRVDPIPRPTASTWRAAVLRGCPRSKKGSEAFAMRAHPIRFSGPECKVIHAVESAFIALYGRIYHEKHPR